MLGQKLRKKSVRQKLNAIDLEFKGKISSLLTTYRKRDN